MTGLWEQAIDVEVAYRHDAVRESYPRRRAAKGRRRRPRPTAELMRRVTAGGAVGMAGAGAGWMTASERR